LKTNSQYFVFFFGPTVTTYPKTMSRNFTLTLLLGLSSIIASPTLSAQTFNPPVISNLDGDVVNYQSYNGVRLDNGNAQVTAGSIADLSRAILRVRVTQGGVPAEDRIRAINITMPTGVLENRGNNLFFNGQYIGAVKGLDTQWEFIIQFEQNANAAAIAAAIRSLVYVNANPDNPTLQTRTITFTLNDGFGNVSTPAIVTLNVPGSNRSPIGVDKSYMVGIDLPLVVPANRGLLSTEADPEGAALNFSITQNPLHGTITPAADGQFSYLPGSGFTGLDSITYNVCDGSGACTSLKALFFVAGSGTNLPPDAVDDRFYMARDEVLYINKSWSILLSDSDPNSGSARIFYAATLVSGPANGTLKLYADGSFRYVPNAGFMGTDQFVYSNCDRQGGCDQATIRIDVSGNTHPLAMHDRMIFAGPVKIDNVLTNDGDAEGDALTASLITAPVNGTVVLYADGSFTYTPNAGYLGLDSLIYQVCDNGTPSLCDTATLSLWHVGNIPPVIAVPGTQTTPSNTNFTFSNNISITDANAAPADLLKMKLTVANGTLTLPATAGLTFTTGSGTGEATFEFTGTLANINNALKTVIYTPASNFNDTDSLRLVVNDQVPGDQMLDSAKVAIIVGPQEPVVTSVTSNASNGVHPVGDTISVQVTFNKPVVVTGNPRILMETGATDRYATFRGGSGGTLLYFRYDVQAGDETSDLDYISTTALELNGGTLSNTGGTNNAILTLPAPGSPASLGGSKNIIIDGVAPTITSIDWPADGLYKSGEVLNFTLHISEAVTVTGSALPVTIGASTVQAALSASTAQTLTYSYTIQNNELDANGIEVAFPAGTILDAGQNALATSTPGLRAGVLVDAIPPVVTAAQVFTIAENATVGTVVGAVAATDAGAVQALQNWQGSTATFSLNAATGQLTVTGTLNAKTTPYYDISVTVSDGVNTSAAVTVRINVTDATPPAIISMDYPADKVYKAGEELVFIAHTNEGVVATSSTLPVTIGTATVQATLKASTATQLTYAYVVLNGQFDADGIAAGTPAGTITDSTGNALLTFTPAPTPAVKVDAIPPVVTAGQVFTIPENATTGTAIGTVLATDAGAVNPLQNWQGSTANFSINAATGSLTLTAALDYEANTSFDIPITVADGVNTSAAVTVKINVIDVNEAPTMNVIPNVTPCAGGTATQLQVTGITPGPETTQTVTLSISADRDIFSTLSIDNTGLISYALKADATGTATVTVTAKDNGGTANNGTDTNSRSFTVSAGAGPTISITSNKGNIISKGETAILTASGASSYEWSTGELTANISVRPFQKTTYQVKGTAANGCMAEGSFELDIKEDFKLDATNIITPNGDGINDRWVVRNIDAYPNNEVKVFDRSGRLIYEKKGYLNEWGGTANGKPLQDGTYYYILDFGPGLPKFKGYITVIRDIK
jgi:gliding motility-associated-like protein